MLSLGEQQRLGLARALLHAPDYLFLDEATASLDEPAEAALYRLLQERLPASTIVSIGHRSTLAAFHHRRLALERDGERFACTRRRSNQREDDHHQRAGHAPRPRATTLCQTNANARAAARRRRPAIRKLQGMSLTTTTADRCRPADGTCG